MSFEHIFRLSSVILHFASLFYVFAPPLPYFSSKVHFIVFFHFAGGQLACFFPQVLSYVLDLDFHAFCVAYALSCRSWSCLCGAFIRPGPPRASCGLDVA